MYVLWCAWQQRFCLGIETSRLFSPLKNTTEKPICCLTRASVRRDPVQSLEESLEMLEKYHNFETAVRCLTPHPTVDRLVVFLFHVRWFSFSPYNSRFVLFHTFLISFVVLPSHSLCLGFYLRGTRPRKSTANPWEKTATELNIISVD